MKYAWIREYRLDFPVKMMCELLEVSTSGFYAWRNRKPSLRAQRKEKIKQDVQQVYEESHKIYGSYKISDVMQERDDLESACRKTVATTMQELSLKSRVCKKYSPTTTVSDPSKKPAENLLKQDFTAEAANQKWVTDITYLATDCGWVYLAVVLDLFSRKVVGWSISDSLDSQLVHDALRNAIESRNPGAGLIHHSDRGCQYTSEKYQKILHTLGLICSMSRKGNCYDNAVMERFFWSLKHEWTNHEIYENLADARLGVFRYIETFYNSERIHQSLGYLSPNQYEAENAPASQRNHVA